MKISRWRRFFDTGMARDEGKNCGLTCWTHKPEAAYQTGFIVRDEVWCELRRLLHSLSPW